MTLSQLILGFVIAMVIVKTLFLIIDRVFITSQPAMSPMPKVPISDLLAEINMLIELECVAVIDVPQSIKDIPLINDFHDIQTQIITNVINSFSSTMWRTCNAAGLKRSYIITYVTRRTQAEILNFMSQHNYAPKDDAEKFLNAMNGESAA